MQYMRKTTGNLWTDYKTNREIKKEPNIITVYTKERNTAESVATYEQNDPNRLPIVIKTTDQ